MGIIGRSPAMLRVYEQIKNAARSDAPVIILGEEKEPMPIGERTLEEPHQLRQADGGGQTRRPCADDDHVKIHCFSFHDYSRLMIVIIKAAGL